MEKIDRLQIQNYKSLKNLNLACSRINVFIGEPNVGKSNILEALDLSDLSWLLLSNDLIQISNEQKLTKEEIEKIDIKKLFRVRDASELFHLGDLSKTISVNYGHAFSGLEIAYNADEKIRLFEWKVQNGSHVTRLDKNFVQQKNSGFPSNYSSPIHPYRFKDDIQFHDVGNYLSKLQSPFGNNLFKVIQHNPEFRDFIEEIISDFPIELVVDTAESDIKFQLRIKKGLVYTLPYRALADTFRRLFFTVAAIRYSNTFVVTLEEPEAHSYPEYILRVAIEIIKSTSPQFFITTHSPYLLNTFIEKTPKNDFSVFVCGYDKENFQTIVKKLSEGDLSELLDYGDDLIFHVNRYLDERVIHNS
ncbi:MAG TPA: AAA family ATPase [Chitinophagales bacterium]|nr:AAA family ATPase [Chitinophagales bacterium]